MTLPQLTLLYLLLGSGLAIAGIAQQGMRDPIHLALLLLLWPLMAPLLFLVPRETSHAQGLEPLQARIAAAQQRVRDIEAVLQQPDFDPQRARDDLARAQDRGEGAALTAARSRLKSIERLHSLRTRCLHELEDIEQLLAHLRVQGEVVRIVGQGDEPHDLLDELTCRVEGLDAVLALHDTST